MVKTKTANGQDQDRLGKDQDLKKMVLKLVLRPSSLLSSIVMIFKWTEEHFALVARIQ